MPYQRSDDEWNKIAAVNLRVVIETNWLCVVYISANDVSQICILLVLTLDLEREFVRIVVREGRDVEFIINLFEVKDAKLVCARDGHFKYIFTF